MFRRRICALLLVLLALSAIAAGCGQKRDIDSYTYEYSYEEYERLRLQPDDAAYLEALNIPEEILPRLTNEALFLALFQHPFLSELRMSAAVGWEFRMQEVEGFAETYNVMREVLDRKDEMREAFLVFGLEWMNELARRSAEQYTEEEREQMNWSPFTAQAVYLRLVPMLYPDVTVIRTPEFEFSAGSFRIEESVTTSYVRNRRQCGSSQMRAYIRER